MTPNAPGKVAVITPTFRRPGNLDQLVQSLFAGTHLPDEVIIVDNDPKASCEPHWRIDWPIRILHSGLGLNLAGARNRGWRAATSDLCFFIDDDNTIAGDTLANLREAVLTPGIGLVAPVIYDATTPSKIWCGGVKRSMWTTRTRFVLRGQTRLPSAITWMTDDMPDAFVIPRNVLESVGGFDEGRFPFHYDEADIACRIRQRGLRVIVLSSASVWHAGGVDRDPGAELFRAFELSGRSRVRFMTYARVYFHRRYSRGAQWLVALAVFIPLYAITVTAACMRLRKPLRSKFAIIGSILSGLRMGYTLK